MKEIPLEPNTYFLLSAATLLIQAIPFHIVIAVLGVVSAISRHYHCGYKRNVIIILYLTIQHCIPLASANPLYIISILAIHSISKSSLTTLLLTPLFLLGSSILPSQLLSITHFFIHTVILQYAKLQNGVSLKTQSTNTSTFKFTLQKAESLYPTSSNNDSTSTKYSKNDVDSGLSPSDTNLRNKSSSISISEGFLYGFLEESLLVFDSKMSLVYSNANGIKTIGQFLNIESMLVSLKSLNIKSDLRQEIGKCLDEKLNYKSKIINMYRDKEDKASYPIMKIRLCYLIKYNCVLAIIKTKRQSHFQGSTYLNEALVEMVSCSMFNDLSNLVYGINGNIDMIDKISDNKSLSYQENAAFFCKVLTYKLRDIDDYGKITSGRLRTRLTLFNLCDLLYELKNTIDMYATMKKVTFTVDTTLISSIDILSDRDRIFRVIMNISYVILENINDGKIKIGTMLESQKEYSISINASVQNKEKIASLFKYDMDKLTDIKQPIENYGGISLIITSLITKQFGNGIKVECYDNSISISINIKDGFRVPSKSPPKLIMRKNSISEGIFEEKPAIIGTCLNKARILHKTKITDKDSFSYLNKYLPIKKSNADCLSDIKIYENDEDEISIGNELEGRNDVKEYSSFHSKISLFPKTTSTINTLKSTRIQSLVQHSAKLEDLITQEKAIDAIVADDNFISKNVLKKLLSNYFINSETVDDGLECVNLVNKMVENKNIYKLKVIFMDLQMPNMNGIAATKEINGILSRANISIPIVGVSADNNDKDKRNFLNAGIVEFVEKPMTKAKLSVIICKYVLHAWKLE